MQIVRDANLVGGLPQKDPANMEPFEYHCAHSYWAYREVSAAIFGDEGQQVAQQVLEDFAQDYGQQMADAVAGYRDVNFNVAR